MLHHITTFLQKFSKRQAVLVEGRGVSIKDLYVIFRSVSLILPLIPIILSFVRALTDSGTEALKPNSSVADCNKIIGLVDNFIQQLEAKLSSKEFSNALFRLYQAAEAQVPNALLNSAQESQAWVENRQAFKDFAIFLSSLNPQAGASIDECLKKLRDVVVELIKCYHQERSHNANMAQHFDHSSKNLIRQGLNIGDNSNAADGAATASAADGTATASAADGAATASAADSAATASAAELPMVQPLPLLPMVQPLPLLPMVQPLPLLPMVQPLPLLPMVQPLPLLPMVQPLPLLPMVANIMILHL